MTTDLLDNPLVVLYFQPDATQKRANADLVVRGMQEVVDLGERILSFQGGQWIESTAVGAYSGFHSEYLRLPDKYQTDVVKVTCPDCKFTYTHQHIFAEGTK